MRSLLFHFLSFFTFPSLPFGSPFFSSSLFSSFPLAFRLLPFFRFLRSKGDDPPVIECNAVSSRMPCRFLSESKCTWATGALSPESLTSLVMSLSAASSAILFFFPFHLSFLSYLYQEIILSR